MRARVLAGLVMGLWSALAVGAPAVGAPAVAAATDGGDAPSSPPGGWVWPVAGTVEVLRAFAAPLTEYGAGHRGVDLATAVGQPVLAAGAGRVSFAGLVAGRGVVVITHGELRTTYEPVKSTVSVGARVAAASAVGVVTAGRHCATSCLHWGLRRGEVYLDPLRLLRRGPIRLLPLPSSGGARELLYREEASERLDRENASGPFPRPGAGAASAGPLRRPDLPAPGLPPPPQSRPNLLLRAAESPWAAGAALALLAGLLLLRRGGSPPRRPAGTPALPASGAAPDAGHAELVDLAAERCRRRAG